MKPFSRATSRHHCMWGNKPCVPKEIKYHPDFVDPENNQEEENSVHKSIGDNGDHEKGNDSKQDNDTTVDHPCFYGTVPIL